MRKEQFFKTTVTEGLSRNLTTTDWFQENKSCRFTHSQPPQDVVLSIESIEHISLMFYRRCISHMCRIFEYNVDFFVNRHTCCVHCELFLSFHLWFLIFFRRPYAARLHPPVCWTRKRYTSVFEDDEEEKSSLLIAYLRADEAWGYSSHDGCSQTRGGGRGVSSQPVQAVCHQTNRKQWQKGKLIHPGALKHLWPAAACLSLFISHLYGRFHGHINYTSTRVLSPSIIHLTTWTYVCEVTFAVA